MARENQDLQIALIVSVMLTIILGVATFLCYRSYSDTAKSLQAAQAEANKKQRDAETARDEANKLKYFLGMAETEGIDSVSKQFNDDMKKYGGAYPEEAQRYRTLVEKMFQTIQDKDKDLVDVKKTNQKLQDDYVIREAGTEVQLKQYRETLDRVKQDLKDLTDAFNKDRNSITQDRDKIKDHLQTVQKETAVLTAKLDEKYKEAEAQLDKTRKAAKQLREENAKLITNVMDNPDGEIRWVNQRNGTVWIDVGRADNLNTLTTFSVYPADVTDLGKGSKKAGIEVTQILGSHLAEARILDDKMSDPIMPGDKIFTPIWNPGDKRHFALAGIMDVNGDGKNNMQLLHNLINMNGGVVDCEIDEKGQKIGEITLQTKYLILGENPGEKGDPNGVAAYSKMLGDAENLGIQKITLSELLSRMGYKSQAHVVNFGSGANPNDFKAKPESGINRASTGNVSEIYKPKEPSRSNTGGAY